MTDTIKISRELLEQLLDSDGIDGVFDAGKNYDAHQKLRALLATPPADAADMGGQAGEEVGVAAWLHQQGNYTEAAERPLLEVEKSRGWIEHELMTVAQHRRILAQHRQQAGKLVEALRRGLGAGRGTSGRIIIDAEDEQVMREALADWEKTSCGK
jgi:hypothetical protein